eukprot:CAMPEP_0203669544 /NCGR_PEP_ID=MMETSP0090-20130426/5880_1 /ASSEMBLY_ACC=CAM_ASM_001088 /TAXON_ID=426623 /ORGANISM="Chaetoceros affinis, Strain CCMP159" /LENGTH=283 /DNA_ID=CAMNT_0050534247 /DNA_START=168 /DNA_END=1019 /DNA_ORIENTATION=-
MKYRVSLQSTSSQIIDTLDKIAQLQLDVVDNGEIDVVKQKQKELSSVVISIRNDITATSSKSKSKSKFTVPLSAISNAKDILSHSNNDGLELAEKLEESLKQSTILSFSKNLSSSSSTTTTPASSEEEKEAKIAYQKRIEKLKLNVEERKYIQLTSNLDTAPKDDATIKSMLYASSVGMNMIVAPISFGVLMYFFAGKLMMWIFSNTDDVESSSIYRSQKDGRLNIHGVIVGVISGVVMLFIEMILFVIRNHEMDKHLTSKKKRNKTNPFGYNEKIAKRTFVG